MWKIVWVYWWVSSVFLKHFNSNPPFHSRHVVFAPKPDKPNTREGSAFNEFYLKKLLVLVAEPCQWIAELSNCMMTLIYYVQNPCEKNRTVAGHIE